MLHHVAVPLLSRPGVHQLVDEGDLLDGVDGVEIVLDPDAVLLELRGDALLPVDGEVPGASLRVLQLSLSQTRDPAQSLSTCRTHLGPFLFPMKLVVLWILS